MLQQNRFTAPSYPSDYFNKVAMVKRSYLPDVVLSDNHVFITIRQYYTLRFCRNQDIFNFYLKIFQCSGNLKVEKMLMRPGKAFDEPEATLSFDFS